LSNVLQSPSSVMFIPLISASNFSLNPTFSYPIRLGTDLCSPATLQQCTTSSKGICCNNDVSPYETITDSNVVLIGLLLPAILLMIRTFLWRAMISTRFSSFGAYEGINCFAVPADCADILVNSLQFDNVSKHDLGETALLTSSPSDVDTSVATIAVITRSGWLLFYWESFVCLAVADLYQAIVIAAVKVITSYQSIYLSVCQTHFFLVSR